MSIRKSFVLTAGAGIAVFLQIGAVNAGEIAGLDIDLTAFQIDAVLCAANTALRVGDPDAVNKVRRIVGGLLSSSAMTPPD